MKKIVFLVVFIFCVFVCCVAQRQVSTCRYSTEQLLDSIHKLNARPVMTADQFIRLYKYDRLKHYYDICKKNGVPFKSKNTKYWNGWASRVFEQ